MPQLLTERNCQEAWKIDHTLLVVLRRAQWRSRRPHARKPTTNVRTRRKADAGLARGAAGPSGGSFMPWEAGRAAAARIAKHFDCYRVWDTR